MRPESVAPLAAVGSDLSSVFGAGGETGDLEADRLEGGRPLEELDCSRSDVTDVGSVHVHRLTDPQRIDPHYTHVTVETLRRLQAPELTAPC